MDALRREIEKLKHYVEQEEAYISYANKLESLLAASRGAYTAAIYGESAQLVVDFCNGLLEEELVPQHLASGTIHMQYGERKQLLAVFKTGDRREYDFQLLKLLANDSDGEESFFQTNLDYIIIEFPSPLLKHVKLLYMLGEAAQDKQQLEQVDETIWLASSQLENTVDSVFVPDAEGVYEAFTHYIENAAQNLVKRKERVLQQLVHVLAELATNFTLLQKGEEYKQHCQTVYRFINEQSEELHTSKQQTVREIQKYIDETKKWDLFPQQAQSLAEVYDTLKASSLSKERLHILSFISSLSSRIQEFKRSVQEFEAAQQTAREQYDGQLGGLRYLIASKASVQEVESLYRIVERKHLACTRWRKEIKESQKQVKRRLEAVLSQIEKDIYNRRKQLIRQAEEAKARYESRAAVQISHYEQACRFLQRYTAMQQLQGYMQQELLPFVRAWGQEAALAAPVIELAKIVAQVGKEPIPIYTEEQMQDMQRSLQADEFPQIEDAKPSYQLKEQVPLEICEEFNPVVPEIIRKKTMYMRPYVYAFSLLVAIGTVLVVI